jgi:peroxiredoxin
VRAEEPDGHDVLEEKALAGFLAAVDQVWSAQTVIRVAESWRRESEEARDAKLRSLFPSQIVMRVPPHREVRAWHQNGAFRVESYAITGSLEEPTPLDVWMFDGEDKAGTIALMNPDPNFPGSGYIEPEDVTRKTCSQHTWTRFFRPFCGLSAGESPHECLALGGKVRLSSPSQVIVRGYPCYELTWEYGPRKAVMYVSPEEGFLPIEITEYYPGGGLRAVKRTEEIASYDGILLPRKWSEEFYEDGQIAMTASVEIHKATFNEEIPASFFKLRFPSNISVIDTVDGQPVYRPKPWQKVGREAPDMDVAEWVSGKSTSLASLRGKTLVLAFWEHTEKECVELIQLLNDMLSEYSERGIEIIAVHAAEADLDALSMFISDKSITYRVALDKPADKYEGATFKKYRVRKAPAVFIIDSKGKVRYQDIPLVAVEEAVKSLLDEQ